MESKRSSHQQLVFTGDNPQTDGWGGGHPAGWVALAPELSDTTTIILKLIPIHTMGLGLIWTESH